MAKAVAAGRRVVLVTCTRGEMGEIVVKDMDTPDNHRRLGEIRAGELERAMGVLGVTEWENLGYHDSDMMGRVGNHDPRRSGRPILTTRPVGSSGSSAATSPTSSRPTTSSAGTGIPTTSGPMTWPCAPSRALGIPPGTRSSSRPNTAEQVRPRMTEGLHPGRRRSSTSRRSRPRCGMPSATRWRRRARQPVDAGSGRHTGAARRVRGVPGADAGAGRDDHDLGRHLGRRPSSGSGTPCRSM